jgi:hypothetical protein
MRRGHEAAAMLLDGGKNRVAGMRLQIIAQKRERTVDGQFGISSHGRGEEREAAGDVQKCFLFTIQMSHGSGLIGQQSEILVVIVIDLLLDVLVLGWHRQTAIAIT